MSALEGFLMLGQKKKIFVILNAIRIGRNRMECEEMVCFLQGGNEWEGIEKNMRDNENEVLVSTCMLNWE